MGKNKRRGWILVVVFLLTGLLCVIVAGNLAIRFAPAWALQADMRSRIDLNSAYIPSQPSFVLQPLDPAILTPPVWINVFLTPGQSIPTRVRNATATPASTLVPTQSPPTGVPTDTPTPTSTFVLFTPTKVFPSNSTPTQTAAGASTSVGTLPSNRNIHTNCNSHGHCHAHCDSYRHKHPNKHSFQHAYQHCYFRCSISPHAYPD